MAKTIMPMATAVWLVEHTSLTFEQIAEFCALHILQVRGIADGEVATNVMGVSPLDNSQLLREEISRCEADPTTKLRMNPAFAVFLDKNKKKVGRYTPVARRQNKPDAIAWIAKNYPEITDGKIIKLIGTTKKTIQAIRDKSHWNFANITPKDPVIAGFCSQQDMNKLISEAEDIRQRSRIKHEEELRSEGVIPASEIMQMHQQKHDFSEEDTTEADNEAAEEAALLQETEQYAAEASERESAKAAENPLKEAEKLFAKFGGDAS